MRRILSNARRPFHYHALRLFRLRDGSDRAARGFALGLIVNFFPTFGFGFLLSGLLAKLCRGHLIAGLAGGALLTPFWPFLFYLNMLIGGWLLDHMPSVTPDQIAEKSMEKFEWGASFLLGACINSLITGLIFYFLVNWLMQEHRGSLLSRLRLRRPKGRQGKRGKPAPVLPR